MNPRIHETAIRAKHTYPKSGSKIYTVFKQTSKNDVRIKRVQFRSELTDSSVTLNEASFELAHSHHVILRKVVLPRNEVEEDPSDPLEPIKSECDDTDVRMRTVEMTVFTVCFLLVLINENKTSNC
jgi:hypothetical protein